MAEPRLRLAPENRLKLLGGLLGFVAVAAGNLVWMLSSARTAPIAGACLAMLLGLVGFIPLEYVRQVRFHTVATNAAPVDVAIYTGAARALYLGGVCLAFGLVHLGVLALLR